MIKRTVARICMPIALTAALVGVVSAVPALAATPTPATPQHTVQGQVVSVTPPSSFLVSSNNTQTPVSVNGSTKYYLIPMGRVESYVSSHVAKDLRQDKNNNRAGAMKELHIPANWRDNLGWLDTFNRAASFGDIAVGDRIIARIGPGNVASQVLIIRGPVVRQVKGTIGLVTGQGANAGTITINGVILNWDASTRFNLKGLIVVGAGQYATAVYNNNGLKALTVNVLPIAPTP
jgi:hypothetical protein